MHWRVDMLWFGIISLLWSAHAANDGDEKYQMWLNTLTVTLVVAGIAASLKLYARFRKLCTALNRQAQQLIRSIEEHRDAADEDERKKKRQEAYRSWDALHELLATKIDTGFDLPGVFVLPPDEIEAVERLVMASTGASLGEEHDEADPGGCGAAAGDPARVPRQNRRAGMTRGRCSTVRIPPYCHAVDAC
ncbi:hypothetical protein QCN29_36245 [Streptomyces sp. HNM0663]|uniref:Uncharacterized protein n=1 Tax=Streptomyces chengmaiensis TaxID=3040919 RepID=A0ABT6HZK6_9ACTN|nr:hypothetical protein [Streptomyces chengmaiensis]MDH2394095.1 hypothetical protein [Streptomyces chengmaiensis]